MSKNHLKNQALVKPLLNKEAIDTLDDADLDSTTKRPTRHRLSLEKKLINKQNLSKQKHLKSSEEESEFTEHALQDMQKHLNISQDLKRILSENEPPLLRKFKEEKERLIATRRLLKSNRLNKRNAQ